MFINSIQTSTVQNLKYLGVNFNTKFNFGDHIMKTMRKTNMISSQLTKVFGSKFINSSVKKCLYKTVLRPVMSYGSAAWVNVTAGQMEILRLYERKMIRRFHYSKGRTQDRRYISTRNLYDNLGLTRIDRHIYFANLKFLRGTYPTNNTEIRRIQNILSLPEDFYEMPDNLIDSHQRGINFNLEGDLIKYHGRSHILGQDHSIPDWV